MMQQGFASMLDDWPVNPFVEDKKRQNVQGPMFRKEWGAVQATGCIGDMEGDGRHMLNDFDCMPSSDEGDC